MDPHRPADVPVCTIEVLKHFQDELELGAESRRFTRGVNFAPSILPVPISRPGSSTPATRRGNRSPERTRQSQRTSFEIGCRLPRDDPTAEAEARGRVCNDRVVSSEVPIVVAYRPDWPERAAALISACQGAFGGLANRLDHIGSTAIPGMAAKDLIDLQVTVADLDLAGRQMDEPLAALGFRRSPYEADHVPCGWTDEPGRWEKRLWTRRGHSEGEVNLHVRHTGAPNERVALLFRDWFRAHPEAVPAYGAFKLVLAQMSPDIDAYADAKDPVVDLVITVAEAWAALVRWKP